jgi:hypothetical protein
VAFQVGVAIILASATFKWMIKRGHDLDSLPQLVGSGGEFLLMAALLIAIGIIFKRGVEIQAENELTV